MPYIVDGDDDDDNASRRAVLSESYKVASPA